MAYALVLGAGMIGVGTALALQAEGKDVILVDKSAPGSETSYGNAGAIQAEAMEPYPMPLDLPTLFRIAIGTENAVDYHFNALLPNFLPLFRYFRNSQPARHKEISGHYGRLIENAVVDHSKWIEAANSDHLITRGGIRQAYRTQKSMDGAAAHAEYMKREYDVDILIEDNAALHKAEPGLKRDMAGSVLWTDTWTCSDPGGLVKAYAKLFAEKGGKVLNGDAMTLTQTSNGWTVETEEGLQSAEHAILALGPWSAEMLPKFGYRNPLLLKRGYHMHFAFPEGDNRSSPRVPIMDVASAAVVAPTEYGIRICTGAQITRYGAGPDPKQLYRGIEAVKELFDLGEQVEDQPWVGNRPCMPDMMPIVGKAPNHENLWFNFGHGHHGFTLGPTSGRLLAEEMISSIAPQPVLGAEGRV